MSWHSVVKMEEEYFVRGEARYSYYKNFGINSLEFIFGCKNTSFFNTEAQDIRESNSFTTMDFQSLL